jgi:hypothetical protein
MGRKAFLALLPLLAGCVIFSSDSADLQTELDNNRALWDVAGITEYSMRFQRLCVFCDVVFLVPVRITVRGDTIDTVTEVDSGDPVVEIAGGAFLTIDEVFDTIQLAIDQNASEIDIRYDEFLGYPTDVNIDLSRSFINDEEQFEIREFQELM